MKNDKKQCTVCFRLTADLRDKLESLAAKERRSLSNYLVLALEDLIAAPEKPGGPTGHMT
jgi:predicted transcriptional regulator